MDRQKLAAFADRLLQETNSALSCLNLYLGHKLGLYAELAGAGKVTAAQLASRTGYNKRYLQEWLACLSVAGYIDHLPETGQFFLCPEHAVALLDPENPAYSAALLCFIPGYARVLDLLQEAFRTGGGVPYQAYGKDILEANSDGARPMFANDYASQWIPAMPDVESRLLAGGRVLDVGCGSGWSGIYLARSFPKTRVEAVDMDESSLRQAARNTAKAGLSDRIVFHLSALEEARLQGPYDLVTAFECVHDMAYPVMALRRMRELSSPGGAVLIAEEAIGDTIEENRNFLGQLMYNHSVLQCLPQSMGLPGSAGTGLIMGPAKLRSYAQEAGFSQVLVLPIQNSVWRFYRLTP